MTDSPRYDASSITPLKGLEAVRRRPAMYLGSTDQRGLHELVYAVVDNSVDEALAGQADSVEVILLSDGGVQVSDDGRGIPVEFVPSYGEPALTIILTRLPAGGCGRGGARAVSGNPYSGIGLPVVNALSERLVAEVQREGFTWRQEFEYGEPTIDVRKGEPTDRHGTVITFWPDQKIFATTDYDAEVLAARFREADLRSGSTFNCGTNAGRSLRNSYRHSRERTWWSTTAEILSTT